MPIFFPMNLFYLRKLKKLSQDEMQARTGILRSTWSNYENGNTEPTFEVLATIARFFEISIDDLLSRDLEKDKTAGGAEGGTPNFKTRNKKQNYPIQEEVGSYVNERDANEIWLVARELRRINEKLDSIRILIEKER